MSEDLNQIEQNVRSGAKKILSFFQGWLEVISALMEKITIERAKKEKRLEEIQKKDILAAQQNAKETTVKCQTFKEKAKRELSETVSAPKALDEESPTVKR